MKLRKKIIINICVFIVVSILALFFMQNQSLLKKLAKGEISITKTVIKHTITPTATPLSTISASSASASSAAASTLPPTPVPTPTPEPKLVLINKYKGSITNYTNAGMRKMAAAPIDLSKCISITKYGVTGKETSDISSKFAKAVYDTAKKGKYLYLPPGTYHLKNCIIRDSRRVRICGAGENTIIKTADTATMENWDIALGFKNVKGVELFNLVLNGNNKKIKGTIEQGVIQLRIENCSDVDIYKCRFEDNNSGNINIVGHLNDFELFNCDFINSDCSVITSPGYITNGYMCNNFIDGEEWKYSEPFSLYYADDKGTNSNLVISGNDIRNHPYCGGAIFISYPSKNIQISHNYFFKCGAAIGSGSQRQTTENKLGPTDVTVSNNIIDSPTWSGISLLYASKWTIASNKITNVTDGWPICLIESSNNVIKNNSIEKKEIYQETSTGNQLIGNQ